MTLRQLVCAADARSRSEWGQAASIMAMIHNVNCAKKSQMKSPADFNPFENRKRDVLHKTKNLSILKQLYVRG